MTTTQDNPRFSDSTDLQQPFQRSSSVQPEMQLPPQTTEVRLEVETLDFDQLTTRLTEFEKEHGLSSLEMFRRYIHGEFDEDDTTEKWFDLFFLYLGTKEVRHFSCP